LLETSSRLHTFVYATLLSIILVCSTVHLSAYVSSFLAPGHPNNLVYMCAIVSGILAPPASFLFALYSHKLIRVQEQLHALATTDPLTDMLNRRAFDAHYAKEGARCLRTGQPVSLLVLDLDFFKQVNNLHGHSGGDFALRELSRCLRGSLRFGTDEVARWGGEEFVILLTNTGRETAIRAALRFRQKIESLNIQFGDKVIKLTASFGIVTCLRDETLEDAVTRADQCLRQAKKQGRNKVVAYPALVAPKAAETAA